MLKTLIQNKPFLIAFVSLLIVLVGVFALYQKTTSLEEELKTVQSNTTDQTDQLTFLNDLATLDGQWITGGNLKTTISNYTALKKSAPESGAGLVQRRLDYLKDVQKSSREGENPELLKLNEQLATQAETISLLENRLQDLRENGDDDLSKLKEELAQVKRQLKEKKNELALRDKVQIITFTSTKGVKVHYLGEVTNGKANGGGMGIWVTGSIYQGEWMNNMRHGKGTFTWADGDKFEGEYVNDMRSGFGTYYFKSGERYEGDWNNDKRSGQGILYDKDSNVRFDGEWEDDKPQVR